MSNLIFYMSYRAILGLDFGIQLLVFVYSAILQTEKFYDVTGSSTFHAIMYYVYYLNPPRTLRQFICWSFVLLWSFRLGAFLFWRVQTHPDRRFDKIKTNPARFAIAWFLQGVWVFITSLSTLQCLFSTKRMPWSFLDSVWSCLWIIGFLIEAVADYQKSAFKQRNPQEFITTGLYRYSQYPNYFGEILLQSSLWLICAPDLSGFEYLSILSPVFIAALIVNVSGVKLAEISQKKRYGDRQDYREWKSRTSKYIPWFPKQQVADGKQL